MATLPAFESKLIFFNPNLDPRSNPDVARRGDLISQLLSFTASGDKDLGDAFAYAIRVLRYSEVAEEDDGWHSGEGISARMSVIG